MAVYLHGVGLRMSRPLLCTKSRCNISRQMVTKPTDNPNLLLHKHNDVKRKRRQIPKMTAENRECHLSIFSRAGAISAYENNVSRQEASRHVLSTSLSLPLLPFPSCLSSLALISPTKHSPSCSPPESISPSPSAAVPQDDSILPSHAAQSKCEPFVDTATHVSATCTKMFAFVFGFLITQQDMRGCGPRHQQLSWLQTCADEFHPHVVNHNRGITLIT